MAIMLPALISVDDLNWGVFLMPELSQKLQALQKRIFAFDGNETFPLSFAAHEMGTDGKGKYFVFLFRYFSLSSCFSFNSRLAGTQKHSHLDAFRGTKEKDEKKR